MFVHSASHTVLHLFVPQGRVSAQHPRVLTEVGYRNAESGLTTLLVPSRPEESWICPRGWTVEAERGANNSGHCHRAVGHKREISLNPGRNVDLDQRRPLRKAAEYLSAAGGRGRKKALLCSITCAHTVWAFPVNLVS